MVTDPLTLQQDDAQTLVSQAAHAFTHAAAQRPDGRALTAALLTLEKTTKQTRHALPVEALLGTWQLCFTAGKKAKYQAGQPIGSGFYIPQWAIARITFAAHDAHESPLRITNQLQIGPLKIQFTGPARYPGQKNLLAFDFTHLEVACFGVAIYQGAVGRKKRAGQAFAEMKIAQLPFFAFFAATEDYVAARGRGGGLAVWVKNHR